MTTKLARFTILLLCDCVSHNHKSDFQYRTRKNQANRIIRLKIFAVNKNVIRFEMNFSMALQIANSPPKLGIRTA
jgi:hypothetical protein